MPVIRLFPARHSTFNSHGCSYPGVIHPTKRNPPVFEKLIRERSRRADDHSTGVLGSAGLALLPHARAQDRLEELDYSEVKLKPVRRTINIAAFRPRILSSTEIAFWPYIDKRPGCPRRERRWAAGTMPTASCRGTRPVHIRFGASTTTGDAACASKGRRLLEGYAATFAADRNPYASPKLPPRGLVG